MIRRATILVALALLAFGLIPVAAEVTVDQHIDFIRTIIMGSITDDPTPIGVWRQIRNVPSNRVLNPEGDDRGDGRPDIAFFSDSAPVAVWSFNHGVDRDIVYSAWTGTEWMPIQFLTFGASDDLDPRLFIAPDNSVHVVWWNEDLLPMVHLQSWNSDLAAWEPPVQVTEGLVPGRRPTVAVHQGMTVVAFEQSPSSVNGMATDLVVATREQDNVFQYRVIASTPRTAPLEIVLHSESGHLWMEWIHDAANLGRSEFKQTGWTPVVLEPSPDNNWIAIEETRRVIRNQVIQGTADADQPTEP